MWQDVCQGKKDGEDKDIAPEAPEDEKQHVIWEVKNNKAYAMITTLVSEEVRRYIHSCKKAFETLQILKEFYDSHSELENIQLLLKLFNLEMKDNGQMKLAFEIMVIFHDIEATGVEVDLQLNVFIEALHRAYSHYLESV